MASRTYTRFDLRTRANVYTDPELLDIAGAVRSLPELPLDADAPEKEAILLQAEGTTGSLVDTVTCLSWLAQKLAPDSGKRGPFVAFAGKSHLKGGGAGGAGISAEKANSH